MSSVRRLTVTSAVHHSGRTRLLRWLPSHSTGNSRQDYAKGMSLSHVSYPFLRCFQQLNALNVNFFTPCLLFSKVAFSLSAGMRMLSFILPTRHLFLIDEFRELWIIPLFFILISGASLVVAWLLAFVFRLNRPQRYVSVPTFLPISSLNTSSRNFAMAAAMIMNSNSSPSRASSIACCFQCQGLNGVKMIRSIPSSDAQSPIFYSVGPWGNS